MTDVGSLATADLRQVVALPDMPTTDRTEGSPRASLSKSLMGHPCQRKGWYADHVRDTRGHKLRFPMPEKVIFGAAIDKGHLELVWAAKEGKEPDIGLAFEKGMAEAKHKQANGEIAGEINWSVFETQVRNALTLFVLNPEGLPALVNNDLLKDIRFQGIDGAALRADDLSGYPDYSWPDGSLMDVKTSGNGKYSETKFWRSAEMPVYALLQASQDGVIPPKLRYQVYVRNVKPYWQFLEMSGSGLLVTLGGLHATHWRTLLAGPVDAAAFDTTYCGDCGFREAIPEANHAGCPIGQSVPTSLEDIAA